MRFLWLCLLLQTCHEWSCLIRKFNFTDALPSATRYISFLKDLLPPGKWQDNVEPAVNFCYTNRQINKYTNTCPGQCLMHCVLDKLFENCPDESWNTSDGCAPLSSISGYTYMFSQSRYANLEKNLPIERRPAWFLRRYFCAKCCDLPPIFNQSLLDECGFDKIIQYHYHETQYLPFRRTEVYNVQDGASMKIDSGAISQNLKLPERTTKTETTAEVGSTKNESVLEDGPQDPMDCCELNEFIEPQWRTECGFGLEWDLEHRLTIQNDKEITTTTTESTPLKHKDVKVVPISCEKQQCIFGKLNIVSDTGVIDKDAYIKLLDNVTKMYPEWSSAKARVLTQCVNKPLFGYGSDCEIYKILACTFDVMSENCPMQNTNDPCKHSTSTKEGVICQISTSKYRPKNRRQFCSIPNLVPNLEIISQCGETMISRLEYVPVTVPNTTPWYNQFHCKELTQTTSCLLNRMGVLNKYKFIDYFKMKDKIRAYTDGLFSTLFGLYNDAFLIAPFYREQCSSAKKLLNVLDSMLMTCPIAKRKSSEKCNKIFTELKNSIPDNITREKLDQMLSHFNNIYFSKQIRSTIRTTTTPNPQIRNNTLYDFGILGSDTAPAVETIDIKPQPKTLVLLPVYQRERKNNPLAINSLHNDGVFRA